MKQIFAQHKVCAILRNISPEHLTEYAEALYNGGIRVFEVAFNTQNAGDQIRLLVHKFGGNALIGAGTVTTKERCLAAKEAGAQFFLTPSVCRITMDFCRKNQIPLLPGVLTPSDVLTCLEYDYKMMKLFPAGAFPENYIKSLKGPFEETEYVAVGGVSAQNAGSYLKAGYIGVGIGSSLVPAEYIQKEQWGKIEGHVRKLTDGLRAESVG
ncbi:bifunctional 4-hydroxy-2-oxoglutarate aldolase/2-dehydro-3-deoxy-phosphogluconate aldolase [bacterium D16-54]|nr:bifunctional 4-hydroxy-2-oxoglutarate aldolase/2-dehydro-3-deoxy-phosphogluconate aldolase [bacterium D16-54]RKJ12105.1 bifunctional 4-hydroxy-2-oxoglutarate aldolase/2-dehydro-3-deoxy-phosphogluconate aldolase [bacterium D16-56]